MEIIKVIPFYSPAVGTALRFADQDVSSDAYAMCRTCPSDGIVDADILRSSVAAPFHPVFVVNTCCCKRITYFCRIVVCVCEVDGWILPISTYWEFVRRVIVAGCESIIIAQRNGTINSDVFSA